MISSTQFEEEDEEVDLKCLSGTEMDETYEVLLKYFKEDKDDADFPENAYNSTKPLYDAFNL